MRRWSARPTGELISYGNAGLVLLYYAKEAFSDFTLKLQFRIFDRANHNSGVFVRYEIDVRGNVFTVRLTNTASGQSKQTTRYQNADTQRGQGPVSSAFKRIQGGLSRIARFRSTTSERDVPAFSVKLAGHGSWMPFKLAALVGMA